MNTNKSSIKNLFVRCRLLDSEWTSDIRSRRIVNRQPNNNGLGVSLHTTVCTIYIYVLHVRRRKQNESLGGVRFLTVRRNDFQHIRFIQTNLIPILPNRQIVQLK